MSRSRRFRTYERDSKRNLYLSLLGIVIILFAVFKFGIPLIASFSLFVAKQDTNTSDKKDLSFINSPILNPLPEATNSAEIIISGRAENGKKVELFINDSLVDKTSANSKGEFEFKNTLSEGTNKIATRIKEENNSSDFSQIFEVIFDSKAPDLSIDSPTDGQSFAKDQNRALIAGKTESDSLVTVNGFRAIVSLSGTFSYNFPLQNGENRIKVIASDIAGNRTEKELKVSYSP